MKQEVTSIVLPVLVAFALAPRASRCEDMETERGAAAGDIYSTLMSERVADIQDLVAWYRITQEDLWPLVPPDAVSVLRQPTGRLLPFDWQAFPAEFTKGLIGREVYGCAVYPVTILEDPASRALVFLNADDEVILRLDAEPDYDPTTLAQGWIPDLLSGRYGSASRAWYMALYDPARLQLKADVIPIEQAPFYAYTAAAVEAASLALAEQEGRGGGVKMAYSGPPVSNLCITAIELLTNKVIRLTITYPWDGASYPEGCFTSRVDLLAAPDLLDRWCELLATTNVSASTNWIEWTDSTASNSTLTPRFYWAGNADLDSDGDGFADAREILMYHSDPANSNSLPVNISGTVTYSGTETGLPLRVLAVTVSNSWATGCSVTLAAPGAYTNAKVATLTSYWFKAFVDVNGNSQREDWEPAGVYSNVALYVTNSRSGVDITVTDVPSLWGTLTYTSAYTEGTVYALACTASNSWSPTHAQSTPWYQNARTDPFTGQTYDGTAFPSNYCILGMPASNYYAKAFVDVDQSGALTAPEPAGFYTNNPVAVSGRVTNVNIVLDRDSDGDGLPDWWEMDNFGNLGQTASGDGDGDGVNNLGEYRQGSDPNCATTTEAPGGETVGLAVYTPLE